MASYTPPTVPPPLFQFHTCLSQPCQDSTQMQLLPQINKVHDIPTSVCKVSATRPGPPPRGAPRTPRLTGPQLPAGLLAVRVSRGPLLPDPARRSDPCAPSSVDIWDRRGPAGPSQPEAASWERRRWEPGWGPGVRAPVRLARVPCQAGARGRCYV